ncbi:MAG TPA: hypothetical protein DDW46_01360, partial [Dehalococcoidia bacterium]|nr:hypothetical protein [Dehalococcoidia bacterium]
MALNPGSAIFSLWKKWNQFFRKIKPMSVPKIFELSCQTQNYNWGRKGSSSLVAQLLKGQSIDENLPYA